MRATASAVRTGHAIAFRALRRNTLQTALTITGMTIGVGTVLTMVSLGTGAQRSIEQQVRAAGMNVIVVTSGNYRMKQQWTSDGETEEQQAFNRADEPGLYRAADLRPDLLSPRLLRTQQSRTNPILEEEQDPANAAGLGASNRLSFDDARAVAALPGVQYVSAGVADNVRMLAGDQAWFTRLHGEMPALLRIRRAWILSHGRFFSEDDAAHAKRVAVVGSLAGRKLFGELNPVGRTVEIKGEPFLVIGEIASASWMLRAAEGDDQFDAVYVPLTAAQNLLHRRDLGSLTVSTVSTGAVTEVSRSISSLLRSRHALSAREPDDFTVATEAHRSLARGGMRTDIARAVVGNVTYLDKVTLDQLGKTLDRAGRTMTALLAAVSTVSLVVGGIGIMNIMLLSVTERTREIGIRRAVGARSQDVMLQFLMEAVLLSLSGGLLGIAAGVAAAIGISASVQWSAYISLGSIALSFGISAAVGILFGFYPARQASRVTPMTSLRYE